MGLTASGIIEPSGLNDGALGQTRRGRRGAALRSGRTDAINDIRARFKVTYASYVVAAIERIGKVSRHKGLLESMVVCAPLMNPSHWAAVRSNPLHHPMR
jgi:hypothetical protein